jgi:hypothetical protein
MTTATYTVDTAHWRPAGSDEDRREIKTLDAGTVELRGGSTPTLTLEMEIVDADSVEALWGLRRRTEDVEWTLRLDGVDDPVTVTASWKGFLPVGARPGPDTPHQAEFVVEDASGVAEAVGL